MVFQFVCCLLDLSQLIVKKYLNISFLTNFEIVPNGLNEELVIFKYSQQAVHYYKTIKAVLMQNTGDNERQLRALSTESLL